MRGRDGMSTPQNRAAAYSQFHISRRAYAIIGSRSGFTVNLGSDSLGKSNDFRRI